jgi:hypothetical protein
LKGAGHAVFIDVQGAGVVEEVASDGGGCGGSTSGEVAGEEAVEVAGDGEGDVTQARHR